MNDIAFEPVKPFIQILKMDSFSRVLKLAKPVADLVKDNCTDFSSPFLEIFDGLH